MRELPQALVLARSFRTFHPEAEFVILVIGRPSEAIAVADATFWSLGDLALEPGEEWRLPMLYRGRDLSDRLLPAFLHRLQNRGAAAVAWFECSTLLFAPLSSAELPDADHAVAATEAIRNSFGDSGRSFIAITSAAELDLKAWLDRARQRSSDDENSFADVPHRVIASPTFAAAYWNLDPKSLASSAGGYEVDGQPLRSFDFRGYDREKPHLLSKYQGHEPRILLSQWHAIAGLCDEYQEKLTDAGATAAKVAGHDFDVLPGGLEIDERMLQFYRNALAEFRRSQFPEPPSPFGPAGEQGFLDWLNGPAGETQSGVTRYMMAVRDEREDVKQAFPDPLGADAKAFRDWYLLFGSRELDLPSALVPGDDARKCGSAGKQRLSAVNVAGYFRAELGLGVAGRALLSALEAAEIPINTVPFGATANRQEHPFEDRKTDVSADINLVCVNPDQLETFAEETGAALRHGRYTIGVWFWEAEDFPNAFHGAFNYVDEIWVASEFMREAFLKVSPKPVFKYVLPIEPPPIDRSLSRADLGLPSQFTFLFTFDLLSVLERKNPVGLIHAFTEAFPQGGGPALVIKTINGDKRPREMEKLRYFARGRSDIILMDGYLSAIQNSTVTALADCYVSLHRSEGFGLTMAEAMALGKPTIATAYSGNLEFMTEENSYLCPYRLCPIGPEREPYPATSEWAEPDIRAAAELFRDVYTQREAAARQGQRAAQDIRAGHGREVAAAIIQQRLATIRERRQASGPVRTPAFLEDMIDELRAENARLRGQLESPAPAPPSL